MEEKLYIEVCCEADTNKATAIIAGGHTCFTYITRNGDILLDKQIASCIEEEDVLDLTLRKVYDFAMTTPLDDIRFILDTARLNKTAAERSFEVNMVMDWVKSYVALTNTGLWATVSSLISFLTLREHVMPVWPVP